MSTKAANGDGEKAKSGPTARDVELCRVFMHFIKGSKNEADGVQLAAKALGYKNAAIGRRKWKEAEKKFLDINFGVTASDAPKLEGEARPITPNTDRKRSAPSKTTFGDGGNDEDGSGEENGGITPSKKAKKAPVKRTPKKTDGPKKPRGKKAAAVKKQEDDAAALAAKDDTTDQKPVKSEGADEPGASTSSEDA